MTALKVFVGRYESRHDLRGDLSKLQERGITPYVFNKDGKFSILVLTTFNRKVAESFVAQLTKIGYEAFIEEPKN